MLPSQPETLKLPLAVRSVAAVMLTGQLCWRLFAGKLYRRCILDQMAVVGIDSLLPALIIAVCASTIFTVQTARELAQMGAINALGGAFALAFCRELAPVLTASVVAGQVGSAFAAELGAMRVTEQIDALLMLKTNPIDYLVLPRTIACCLMLPILNLCALAVGLVSGTLAAMQFYQVEPASFLNSIQEFLSLWDLFRLIGKGILFGAAIAIIGCNWGMTARGGAREVGQSATAAVVAAWIAIFILDTALTMAIFGGLAF
ncbi:MAG: MlaE family lipid ABC transporter permease subunit [Spirulinaceae cyanobacterium SM2_1_0]|nr:MlaE family lipid ABC transporter permease subunit [Spirulinaceae cyanobacterium SM2_1_0]